MSRESIDLTNNHYLLLRSKEIGRRKGVFLSLGFTPEWIDSFMKKEPTLLKDETVIGKINGFKERGFTDPVKLMLTFPNTITISFENVDSKLLALKERGFSNPVKLVSSSPVIFSYSFENIDSRLKGLQESGFTDPIRLISKCPAILHLSTENIMSKLQELRKRGFTDPIKLITTFPDILSLASGNIDNKLKGLEERGFTDPVKLISSSPDIFGYGFENIDNKLQGLKERGFSNPIKLVSSSPVIFSYGFENIDNKIKGLQERGFTDPVKLISTTPAIFNLSFKNIDRRLSFLNKVIELYNLPFTSTNLMEQVFYLWGTKFEKIVTVTRVGKEYADTQYRAGKTPLPDLNINLIASLIRNNIDTTVAAYTIGEKEGIIAEESLSEFSKRTKRLNGEDLSRDEKRQIIDTLPSNNKVKREYFKGYPK